MPLVDAACSSTVAGISTLAALAGGAAASPAAKSVQ